MGKLALALAFSTCLLAQSGGPSGAPPDPPTDEPERWNLYYQATSIGDYHGMFNAPYTGPLSLQDIVERDVSITTTLFYGLRLNDNLRFFFDPEIAGGRGFSNVNGLADPANGEIPRVAGATPKPYIARLFLSYDVGFGHKKEHVDSEENSLAGERPVTRYTVSVGRFSVTDFFDDNAYSHDPRTQFLSWGIMYNGAWDYPADVRGYSWGIVNEFRTRNWSFRAGAAAEPKTANGPRFDRRLFVDLGVAFEQERRFTVRSHPGTVRLLEYQNRTDSGHYADAIRQGQQTGTTPDITAVHKPGTLKYGFGVSADQELTKNIGVFMRLGWNDGKTQSFAFTAIDRLAEAGVSVKGTRWHRKDDVLASAFSTAGISGVHAVYLALGGLDFLIGDGKLNYAPEYLWESYYSAHVAPGFYVTLDGQHYNNPAYNHDRGPVWVASIRLHLELGLKPWSAK
jgi:high affinity Mn2+ porin